MPLSVAPRRPLDREQVQRGRLLLRLEAGGGAILLSPFPRRGAATAAETEILLGAPYGGSETTAKKQ